MAVAAARAHAHARLVDQRHPRLPDADLLRHGRLLHRAAAGALWHAARRLEPLHAYRRAVRRRLDHRVAAGHAARRHWLCRAGSYARRLCIGRDLEIRRPDASVVPRISDRALCPGRHRGGAGPARADARCAAVAAAGVPLDRAVGLGTGDPGRAVLRRAAPDAQSLDRGSAGLHPGVPHRRGLRHPVRLRLAAVPSQGPAGRADPARLALCRAGRRGERRLSLQLLPADRSLDQVLPDPRRARGRHVAADLWASPACSCATSPATAPIGAISAIARISSTSPTCR